LEKWRNGSSLHLRAAAKINWFLTIRGKRQNGYHDIESFLQCIDLFDVLEFSHAEKIEVISDLDIPKEDNLVFRAAVLLKRYHAYKKGARIILHKKIPHGAGLGGGSSDAAYTLLGLSKLWGLRLNKRKLYELGLEIGSDVPFFLNGPSAFVEGRGEKVTPLSINARMILLLVKPWVTVSTAWAYGQFDRLMAGRLTKKPVDIKLFCQALEEGDFTSLGSMLTNDLEGVVVERYPVVGKIKELLVRKGAAVSGMSGSGPTVFGVFKSREMASAVAREMRTHWCRVVKTVKSGVK